MTAAVYAAEIREEYDCGRCAQSSYEWSRLGRCTGPLRDGDAVELPISDATEGGQTYPVRFSACPMGYLREDLRPEATIARIVSHAVAAKAERRWPDLPARLAALINVWHGAESDRMTARQDAMMPAKARPARRRRVRV